MKKQVRKKKIRFQYGDVVVFRPKTGNYSACPNKALAYVVGYVPKSPPHRGSEWLSVLWLKNGDDRGQCDGNYEPKDFELFLRPRI